MRNKPKGQGPRLTAWACLPFILFSGLPVLADRETCFDLSKPNTKPLISEPAPLDSNAPDFTVKGTSPETGYAWAQASGRVPKSTHLLLKKLYDPMTTRDPDITRVRTSELLTPGTLKHLLIKVTVKPIFFLTLEWEEDWQFTALSSSGTDAKGVLISYQKVSGTSHIQHFCGSILLRPLGPEVTQVTLAEEIRADRRGPEEVLNGLLGTLKTLRGKFE